MSKLNPFLTESCLRNSCFLDSNGYGVVEGKTIQRTTIDRIRQQLHSFIVESQHPCVGAQHAIRKNDFYWGIYDELGSSTAADGMCRDIYSFIEAQEASKSLYTTYISVFLTPNKMSEPEFEKRIWSQLDCIAELSGNFFPWDSSVSDDPTSSKFSFSCAGRAFFVVGMHPDSSRIARRFPYAALAFNLHSQFENLRQTGRYENMKLAIRKRDLHLQGSINPMLSDFGEHSEARQYSGRAVESDWKCPFGQGAQVQGKSYDL